MMVQQRFINKKHKANYPIKASKGTILSIPCLTKTSDMPLAEQRTRKKGLAHPKELSYFVVFLCGFLTYFI